MVSIEAFSELLEVLYSAPLDQQQWQRFLTLVCQHTQAKTGYFLCADSHLGFSVRAFGGPSREEQYVADYNQRYAARDPFRGPVIRMGRTGVFQSSEIYPDRVLLASEFYRDLLAPQGLRYATLIALTLTVRRFDAMSVWRTAECGPMDDDCSQLLRLLVPHIQQALQIRKALGITEKRLAGATVVADASSTAAFLLTRGGTVVYRNAAANSILRDGDVLAMQKKTLTVKTAQGHNLLRDLIEDMAMQDIAGLGSSPATRAISLPRPSDRRPIQVLASPLPPAHRARAGADVLLLITDPERAVNFPDDILYSLYGLTSAETEVANGLLMGYSLQEISSLRKVAIGTVRNQVKSVLSKTSCTRQSDLLRLLTTLPQPTAVA